MKCPPWGLTDLAETRAYFPSREEAEQFARQFEGSRYHIAILPEHRQGRDVFQVHVQHGEHLRDPAATDLMKLLGSLGPRARGAGLDGDALSRQMGQALGSALASKQAPGIIERRKALHQLGTLLDQCGLGGLSVLSVTPLVLRVQVAPSLAVLDRGRGCAHVAGFIEGALGSFLGEAPRVREIDCVGLGNAYCTFSVDL